MFNVLNKYNIGKKKLIGIGIFIMLFLIVLPLTLIQVQKQQELRQRAEELSNVYLEFKPSIEGKKAIETQFIQTLYLQNPLNKDISAVDVVLTYNKDQLDVIDFISEGILSDIVKSTSIPGEVHYVGINSSQTRIIDSTIPLGAFILKAKKEGNGTIDFSKVTITAIGEAEPLAINPADKKPGSYIIGEVVQSVLTPSIVPTPTPTPAQLAIEDLNNDGVIDGIDYNMSLRLSLTPSPSSSMCNPPNYCASSNECLTAGGNSLGTKTCIGGEICCQPPASDTPTPIPGAIRPTSTLRPTRTPTPTPGLFPYAYTIFPEEGPQGTIFTVTVKTPAQLNDGSRLAINFYLLANQLHLQNGLDYDKNNYADGFYNYVFSLDSSKYKAQNVEVKFQFSDGEKTTFYSVTDTGSFKILSGSAGDKCVPIIKNGDISKKINIVVISNNYKESELNNFKNKILPDHIDGIFRKDPFSLNKDKFNIFFVNKVSSLSCSSEDDGGCSSHFSESAYENCPFFDQIIVIDKNSSRSYADVRLGDRISYNLGGNLSVTVHEFGHSFGLLSDEYDKSDEPPDPYWGRLNSDTSAANCDVFGCPKWCKGESSLEKPYCSGDTKTTCQDSKNSGVSCKWSSNSECVYPYDKVGKLNFGQSCDSDTGCYYGCGGDGYRSSKNSIMNNTFASDGKEFNAVSKKQIQKQIDFYMDNL